jgi:hypothetical protein
MRKLLMAVSAFALLGGGSAFAENQNLYTGVSATTNTTGATVNNGIQSQTQAVGNVLSVGSSVLTYNSVGDTQATDNHNTSITATSNLESSTISGVSNVSTLAEGNDQEINPGSTASLQGGGGAGPINQTTGYQDPTTHALSGETEVATTNVGDGGAVSFNGNAGVNAAAVGNNVLTSAQNGTGYQTPPFSQVNDAGETASVTLDNTNVAGGVLNSEAQAVGDSFSAGGIVTAGSALTQTSNAGQTATENFHGNNLLSSGVGAAGNNVVSSAEGNFASIGQVTGGSVLQTNTAPEAATTNVSNSTVNGDFSSQAAGNILSFDSNTATTVSGQVDTASSTADTNVSGPVDLNAATTFASLAIGNQFTGTLSPAQAPYYNQQSSGPINATSTVSGVTANGFAATVQTTATANLATMTSPGGFQQVASAAPTALANISASSFSGGLTVSTAAIGNSIAIK